MDKIKENEIKEKIIKEYKRRLRLILKSKLNGKNKIKAIHTWAVTIFRHGTGITQWKESELKKKIKENNDNVWSITFEERCGQIVH